LVLANDLIQRNLARFSVSTAARIDILSTFVFRFLSNPILGIGFESSLHIDSIYFDLPKRAHNTFLAILTGTGLFGFFPFMMFFGIHFNNLLKARAKLFDDNLILANLLVAMFIMALISMLVQTSFVSTQFWVFLAWQGAMINTAFIQNSQPAKIHPVHS
jgi:O-antigen ligase